jgi:hypothetical protein
MNEELREDLEEIAEAIDDVIHHEVLPDIPGKILIEPTVDDLNWKDPTSGIGIKITFTCPF